MTVSEVIGYFCNKRGVGIAQVLSRLDQLNVNITRYMIWHYLHKHMSVSAGRLGVIFKRNRPTIFRGIRVLETHMNFHSELKNTYYDIVKELEGLE